MRRPPCLEGADALARYLSDASRTPGGAAPRAYLPRSEGEVAWVLRNEDRVLPVGAQSSLTGGATPRGDALLSSERLDGIGPLRQDRVRVEAGVALLTLREALAADDAFYPPAPTFEGATLGGTIATNAAGAATFKYGTTRDWVEALTVVLASGHVLDLRRGDVHAGPAGTFEVVLPGGQVREVRVPGYELPKVPKRSAGYHAAPGMDLVDLFVGSEGTLGVVVSAEVRVLRPAPPSLVAFVALPSEARALGLVRALREASRRTWATHDPRGIDVRSIESIDRRCIELLREDGEPRVRSLARDVECALFVVCELPPDFDPEAALEAYADGAGRDDPLRRLCDLLAAHEALDSAELALPGDRAGREALFALREAVPVAVNHRVEAAQRTIDERIHKVAADMIVPFERFADALAAYREELSARGLDHAIWGHVSDGNVHPNVLPRSYDDVRAGYEAFLACGRRIRALGGCPLSEHGTGRNPLKQALLRELYGPEGIAAMRSVKRALDPEGKLARDVVFPFVEE